ncbi:MAG TPA: L,D-transpeptidase family protein [Acidimicrobiales bacterium]|nr:L,D-transpeptidase family protein [Acidimicrobiales bacterium]
MSTRPPVAKVLVVLLALGVLGMIPAPPASAQVAAPPTGDGTVFGFGAAPLLGSTEGTALRSPVVAMAATATGLGYWLVAADGGVFAFGDAVFAGSTGSLPLRQPIVSLVPTASGKGYWLVASDGGAFAFGDAVFAGSTGGMPLNQPIVGGARAKDGYLMVARDGGVFAFGAAPFLGSAGGIPLRRPVVGMATTPTGLGYWLVAADGGIFAYGDAGFHGSTAALPLSRPIVGMAATPSGAGYWLVGADGGVFAFGDAPSTGSAVGAIPSGRQALGITRAAGAGFWLVAGRPPLTLGAVGPGVENLQRRLFDLGYWGPVDGRFGSLTTQQVYAFQKVNGLPRDGVLDAAEMTVLEQAGRPIARGGTGGLSVEVDKTRQVLFVLRDGQVEWTFNTSTGNNRPYGSGAVAVTPEGRFTFTRQINALRISPLGALFRPKYFVGGYAIHGSPSVPPFPASHGCVRLTNAAINFIWDQNVVPLGTPLWVYS